MPEQCALADVYEVNLGPTRTSQLLLQSWKRYRGCRSSLVKIRTSIQGRQLRQFHVLRFETVEDAGLICSMPDALPPPA